MSITVHGEMSSPYLRIGSSEVSLADNDGLAEELIARMALYDAALVESAGPTFLETALLSPPLQSRWGRLKSCLRLLRDIYPRWGTVS